MTDNAIRFLAQVYKVQTLVDGGIRVTLDLVPPASDRAVMDLMKCRMPGVLVECAAVAIDAEVKKEDSYGL